ncbi:putative peptidase DUF31 [Mycoplasma testudineum]|uniref:Putative peptidase DUF31 n=1 Tax=Mycoplasma testudineum TaxID=244584 RepID=A0A4R6IBS7_9MOLU|nr:hypothetical protein [Mycoplasma testudineum]OYD26510.1 hypothetical protein CG473_03655 [Mycoplasma testudineum]TDO18997.1 putative peptidase DUF31 [Mycoplasma testudineum]
MKINKRTLLLASLPIVASASIIIAVSCSNNLTPETIEPIETSPNQPVTPTPTPTPEPTPTNPTPSNPDTGSQNTSPQPGQPGANSGTPGNSTDPDFGDNDPSENPYDSFVTERAEPTFKSDIPAINSRIERYTTPNYNGRGIVETGDAAKFITIDSESYKDVKNDQYETLKDYSFKVEIDRNEKQAERDQFKYESGTAWVLDYIKPEDGSYPLTWFFGTNLHVIINMDFSKGGENAKKLGLQFRFRDIENPLDTAILSNYPELFFSAHNFLGDSIELNPMIGNYYFEDQFNYKDVKNYAKDFAVIKVQFKDENEAKHITRGFATKYPSPKIQFPKTNILDKTSEEIAAFDQAYVLGYAGTSAAPTINKRVGDVISNKGSKYSDLVRSYMITNAYGQRIPGVYDSIYINGNAMATLDTPTSSGIKYAFPNDFWLAGDYYHRFGMGIGFETDNLFQGASGSLSIDNNFNALGIQWGNEGTSQTGLLETFTSKEVLNAQGKRVFYDYDLINGGGKLQTRSFSSLLKDQFAGKTSFLFGKLPEKNSA